jgi:hypothetical protein
VDSGTLDSSSPDTATVLLDSGTDTSITDTGAAAFTVGGTVSGLAPGNTVVLQDNGGDNLTVVGSTSFTFTAVVTSGHPYSVTVLTQPGNPPESCTVVDGMGSASGASVTSVQVTCVVNVCTFGSQFGSCVFAP